MKTLETICFWKNQEETKKKENPNYHPIGNPLFICLYSCDGKNKSCGGYKKYEEEKERP